MLDAWCDLPERPERGDLALLAGLLAVGLVPFARLAVGAHWTGPRLLLGAALVLVSGGQLVAGLRRPRPGGVRHGLRVRRSHLVLLRGDLEPGVALRPPVKARR